MNAFLKTFLILGSFTSFGLLAYAFVFPIEKTMSSMAALFSFGFAAVGFPTLLAWHLDRKDRKMELKQ